MERSILLEDCFTTLSENVCYHSWKNHLVFLDVYYSCHLLFLRKRNYVTVESILNIVSPFTSSRIVQSLWILTYFSKDCLRDHLSKESIVTCKTIKTAIYRAVLSYSNFMSRIIWWDCSGLLSSWFIVQYNTIQYSTVQCSAVQCNTINFINSPNGFFRIN